MTTMSHDHLDEFLAAMHAKDADGALEHVADDVKLWSPIFVDPFEGKAKVSAVLGVVMGAMDSFEVLEVMHGLAHSVVAFRFSAGGNSLDGVDLMTLNGTGLIATLKIMWRPLPAVVAMQNRIAAAIGAPVMTLVAATPAVA